MESTFLTGKEIAQILKISKPLVYRLLAKGQIASIRFGRVIRVRQEDLDKFIQKYMQKPDIDQKEAAATNIGLQEKGDIQQGA